MGKEFMSRSKYTFSPEWLHEPRQTTTLLSRFVTRPGTKEGNCFHFDTLAQNHPLVPGGITNHDKIHPFCHGSLHDLGLKVCLYIKAATLPLQHLATFSSLIHCHHRRRVLPPSSSSLTAAFRGTPRPLPHGILRRRWLLKICRRPHPPPHRRPPECGRLPP
jgi:hypothetical protein